MSLSKKLISWALIYMKFQWPDKWTCVVMISTRSKRFALTSSCLSPLSFWTEYYDFLLCVLFPWKRFNQSVLAIIFIIYKSQVTAKYHIFLMRINSSSSAFCSELISLRLVLLLFWTPKSNYNSSFWKYNQYQILDLSCAFIGNPSLCILGIYRTYI